jgi:hypothetical protein
VTDLHTRLTAVITARLDVARAAQADPQTYAIPARGINPVRDHYALWDPTTAIRVLEALQEVVERHAPTHIPFRAAGVSIGWVTPSRDVPACDVCDYDESADWPCPDVLSVAAALGVEVE